MKTAKTRPALIETADRIIAMLPEDAATTLEGWIKTKNAAPASTMRRRTSGDHDRATPRPPTPRPLRRRPTPSATPHGGADARQAEARRADQQRRAAAVAGSPGRHADAVQT